MWMGLALNVLHALFGHKTSVKPVQIEMGGQLRPNLTIELLNATRSKRLVGLNGFSNILGR